MVHRRLSVGVLFVVTGWAQPVVTTVVNSASYASGVSGGSLATIIGTGLSDHDSLSEPGCAITSPFPTMLCGVQVRVDGMLAPLLYIGSSQINLQVPYAVGTHQVVVVNNAQQSIPFSLSVLDRSPGIFTYSTLNNDGTVNFRNLAAAELGDYSVHSPTNPVMLGTPSLQSYLTLYVTGLGVPSSGSPPPLGTPAAGAVPVGSVTVFVNGNALPASSVLYAGYAPGSIIQQINILPPPTTPSGATTVRVCTDTTTCSNDVTVFMTTTPNYLALNFTHPGSMSDGMTRTLDTITGSITSDTGTMPLTVNQDGNSLTPARGNTTIGTNGNTEWESYTNTTTVNGPTTLPNIIAFPNVQYPTTDVKGDYDRTTRTWTNIGYNDPIFGWTGATNGGTVTLLEMTDYLSTNGYNSACTDITVAFTRADQPLKIFIDPTNQPYYNPTPNAIGQNVLLPAGTTLPNAIAGSDIVWQQLLASPAHGGPTFQQLTENPVAAGIDGIYFQFSNDLPPGYGGTTIDQPSGSGNSRPCLPIANATSISVTMWGDTAGVAATARHEVLGRAVGYAWHNSSPFGTDNMAALESGTDTARDLDGRKIQQALGPGVDISRYGQQ